MPGRCRLSRNPSHQGATPIRDAATKPQGQSAATDERSGVARGDEDSTVADGQCRRPRILVVEDEPMIRMLLEDMLADSGYNVVASAGRVDEALRIAGEADFDVAILDLNLAGELVTPVAEILEQRGLPFVFATGYGERGLPEQYRSRPMLQKPFHQDNLDRVLARVVRTPPA
jgi:CheY-like chemotaxis protein